MRKRWAAGPPLPKGEGWGEGGMITRLRGAGTLRQARRGVPTCLGPAGQGIRGRARREGNGAARVHGILVVIMVVVVTGPWRSRKPELQESMGTPELFSLHSALLRKPGLGAKRLPQEYAPHGGLTLRQELSGVQCFFFAGSGPRVSRVAKKPILANPFRIGGSAGTGAGEYSGEWRTQAKQTLSGLDPHAAWGLGWPP